MSMPVQLTVSNLKNVDCVTNATLREKRTEFRGENVLGKRLLARPARNGR
jgi:hypothetical protein